MKREVSSLTINDAFQGKWFVGGEQYGKTL